MTRWQAAHKDIFFRVLWLPCRLLHPLHGVMKSSQGYTQVVFCQACHDIIIRHVICITTAHILSVVVADLTEPRHFRIALMYCMTQKAMPAFIAASAVAHQSSLLNWFVQRLPETALRDCLNAELHDTQNPSTAAVIA